MASAIREADPVGKLRDARRQIEYELQQLVFLAVKKTLKDLGEGYTTSPPPVSSSLFYALDNYVDTRVALIMADSDWNGAQLLKVGEVKT